MSRPFALVPAIIFDDHPLFRSCLLCLCELSTVAILSFSFYSVYFDFFFLNCLWCVCCCVPAVTHIVSFLWADCRVNVFHPPIENFESTCVESEGGVGDSVVAAVAEQER